MTITWKPTTGTKYWEMLEVLPPAVMTGRGFLVGEPVTHGLCPVTGKFGALFDGFVEVDGAFYVAEQPMSVKGFEALSLRPTINLIATPKGWDTVDTSTEETA
jgi:hypothetical protein